MNTEQIEATLCLYSEKGMTVLVTLPIRRSILQTFAGRLFREPDPDPLDMYNLFHILSRTSEGIPFTPIAFRAADVSRIGDEKSMDGNTLSTPVVRLKTEFDTP